MNPIHKSLTASFVLLMLCAVMPRVNSQGQIATPTSNIRGKLSKEPRWLKLARQITAFGNAQPKKEKRDLTQSESDAFDIAQRASDELDKMPLKQIIQAYQYILANSVNANFRASAISTLLVGENSAEMIDYVKPFFNKLPDNLKTSLLVSPIYDAIMLRPEVPKLREFALELLQEGARNSKISDDLISQAALILVVHTSVNEKQAMHDALARHPEAGGVWNALTQLQDLTPSERELARQMFDLKREQPGWRLTLAAALSPYDAEMRELVRQSVEAEIETIGYSDFPSLLMKELPTTSRLRWGQSKARSEHLVVLRFWELKQALPYLQRALRAKNPMARRMAMPVLAMRAPQEVLRIANTPYRREKREQTTYGVTLAALLHPQFRLKAEELLADRDEKEEGREAVEENFRDILQEVRNKGVGGAF